MTTKRWEAGAAAVKYAREDLGWPRAEMRGIVFRDRPPVYPATAEALVLIEVPQVHRMPSGRPRVNAQPQRFALLVQQVGDGKPFHVTDETEASDFYRNGGHDDAAAQEAR